MADRALKPCPFCGQQVQFEENASKATAGISWSIMCLTDNCIMYDATPWLYPTKGDAARAWNMRANLHEAIQSDTAGDVPQRGTERPRGKPCTCDNCLGSSCPCYVDDGGVLGELWYCRKRADAQSSPQKGTTDHRGGKHG